MDVPPEQFVDRLLTEEGSDAPSDDCKCSELELQLPPWYNDQLYAAGRKFFQDNLFGVVGTQVLGVLTIISVPTTLEVLVHTRKSSSSFTAYRRYTSTLLHLLTWNSQQLRPGNRVWQSLLAVRKRHLQADRTARTLGVGSVTQRDIALTQFGFVAHTMLYPDRFGIVAYDRNSWEGFNHLWKTITYMLGLKDRYNICAGTVEQTREVCRLLMSRVFAPLLEFPPEPYEHMARVIVDSLWSIVPLLEPKAIMYITRLLAGVPGYVYTEQELIDFRKKIINGEIERTPKAVKQGWHTPTPRAEFNPDSYRILADVPEYRKLHFTDKLKLNTIMFLAHVNATFLGKFVLNCIIKFLIFLAEYFPILAFFRFGYYKSFVNMFEESISDKTKPMSNAEVVKMYSQPSFYARFYPLTSMKHTKH